MGWIFAAVSSWGHQIDERPPPCDIPLQQEHTNVETRIKSRLVPDDA
jgi:hypothetical protein